MRLHRLLLVVGTLILVLPVRAEDWTASDGTIYKDVKVLSHDDGFVNILDSDGGARVPLRTLPAAIQSRFGYDPVKAKACEAARLAQDKADRAALAAEEEAQDKKYQASLVASAPAPSPASANPPSPAQASSSDQNDQMVAAQKADLQEQIQSLQEDVTEMQKQQAEEASHPNYTHGGLSDKIAEDNAKIRDLQSQLSALH